MSEAWQPIRLRQMSEVESMLPSLLFLDTPSIILMTMTSIKFRVQVIYHNIKASENGLQVNIKMKITRIKVTINEHKNNKVLTVCVGNREEGEED